MRLGVIKKKHYSYWWMVWSEFKKNKMAMCGLVVIFFFGFIATFAPFIANDVPIVMKKNNRIYLFPNVIKYSDLLSENLYANFDLWKPAPGEWCIKPIVPFGPLRQNLEVVLHPPNRIHWLGTDDRGRDVLSRMIWGARLSLSVGFVSVGIAVLMGIVLGSLAGFLGSWVDTVVLRLIELMLVIPTFFLIITVMAFLPPSVWTIMVVIGLTSWPGVARLVRGEFLRQREMEYVLSAKVLGLSGIRTMFRHVLPNALGPVYVSATFGLAGAILMESGLSFLGFGAPPPTPSWGELLKQSQSYVDFAWWLVLFPGLAIFITVTAFNLVGEGLRDAMDPRLRGGR
ncbi:MAG: ABC transporter permease [Candidatus Hydrogenedentes bacterium]|nr:ABC transporter permease [Candidatus Hydrogenedentota bacterium]